MKRFLSPIAPACLGIGLIWGGMASASTMTEREEELVLEMSAAVDSNCNGRLEDETLENASFETAKLLNPGECIVYRTDYRNVGDFPLRKVEVRTPVPDYMVYVSGTAQHVETPPGLSAVPLREPEDGWSGDLFWTFSGGLGPGESGRVEFMVKLLP